MKPKIWPKILFSFEYRCTSVFFLFKIRIKNKQVIARNYIIKYSQIDIKNQVPLTLYSRLCNRLHWFLTEVLKFINKWNQRITRSQYLLCKVSQNKFKNMFYLLVSRLFLVGMDFVLTDFLENYDTKNPELKLLWLKCVWWDLIKTIW